MSEFVKTLQESTIELCAAIGQASYSEQGYRNAKADAETLERQTIAAAYANGAIDGKNAETRKAQEAQALAEDDHLRRASDIAKGREEANRKAQLALEIARIRYATAKELVRWEAAMTSMREMEY